MIQITENARLHLKSMLRTTLLLYVALGASVFFFKQVGQYAGFSRANTQLQETTLTIAGPTDIMNEDGSSIATPDQRGNEAWFGSAQKSNQSYLGLRFNGKVPVTNEIESAYLEITSSKNQWIVVKTKITAEKNINPATFSSSARPSQRTTTAAVTTYSNNVRWSMNEKYKIKVTDQVKEVLSLPGRSTDTPIVLILRGYGNAWARKYIKANTTTGETPKLVIVYRSSVIPTVQPELTPTIIRPTSVPHTPTSQPSPILPSSVPSPTQMVHGETGTSHAFGVWTPNPKWDTCSKEIHDSYALVGPDGKKYPTWHPPIDPKTGCKFGHEHGRDPSGADMLALAKDTYGGILFGYANEKLDEWNTNSGISNGMRHEDHVGHKIEWENNVQMRVNKCSRPASDGCFETVATNITCDFLMKAHQGTHSQDAFTNNLHELSYFVDCSDGTKIAATKMVAFGKPGEFMTTCDKNRTIQVGAANPPNSRSGGGVRFIADKQCVDKHILVGSSQWSEFSLGLYEDWISANYIKTSNGETLAYFDPHFAVFTPSRYYDPTKPNNVGRSIDTCYMTESNGEKARGGECTWMGDLDPNNPITYDDPRSVMNGVKREFYFNQSWVKNSTGQTGWYTDPFGENAKTTNFTGAIKQYISATDNYNKTIFESQAIGANRNYGGNGVHAPN